MKDYKIWWNKNKSVKKQGKKTVLIKDLEELEKIKKRRKKQSNSKTKNNLRNKFKLLKQKNKIRKN